MTSRFIYKVIRIKAGFCADDNHLRDHGKREKSLIASCDGQAGGQAQNCVCSSHCFIRSVNTVNFRHDQPPFFISLPFCSVYKYRPFFDKLPRLSRIKDNTLSSFLHLFPPCLRSVIMLNAQICGLSAESRGLRLVGALALNGRFRRLCYSQKCTNLLSQQIVTVDAIEMAG